MAPMGWTTPPPALVAAALMALSVACAGEGESGSKTTPAGSLVALREFRVGGAIDSTGAVVAPVDSFAPRDTVYASLAAEGDVDRAILTARWTRAEGVLMGERQEVFPLEGRRIVTFRLSDPDGLPPGQYRVEVHLGTDAIGSESFRVVDPERVANPEEEVDG